MQFSGLLALYFETGPPPGPAVIIYATDRTIIVLTVPVAATVDTAERDIALASETRSIDVTTQDRATQLATQTRPFTLETEALP